MSYNSKDKIDFSIIGKMIKQNSVVLDIGCGQGDLLYYLKQHRNISARGMEKDNKLVERAMSQGLNVIQGNANTDLASFPSQSCEYAILSKTLQIMEKPHLVLKEMLRIAKYTILNIENFGYITNRLFLSFKGKMPVTKPLPYSWYDTPNIHFCTINDFKELAQVTGFIIEKEVYLKYNKLLNSKFSRQFANLLSTNGIFMISSGIVEKSIEPTSHKKEHHKISKMPAFLKS